MASKTILIVEDEQPIREMLALSLERSEFLVLQAASAAEADKLLADVLPDLILLDWMMPGVSGIEYARALRRDEYTRDVPIIMLTARGEEDDRVRGLECGADDYVVKPFSPRELTARIQAVIRRSSAEDAGGVIEAGGLQLDTKSHRISANGRELDVGPTEFRLLHFFMANPERVYSRGQLLDRVWSRGSVVEERTVDVHIRRLRKVLALADADRFIQTVRGTGYRFSLQV